MTQEEREAAVAKLEEKLAGLFSRLKVFEEAEKRNGYSSKESVWMQAYYREQIEATDEGIYYLACPPRDVPADNGDEPDDV